MGSAGRPQIGRLSPPNSASEYTRGCSSATSAREPSSRASSSSKKPLVWYTRRSPLSFCNVCCVAASAVSENELKASTVPTPRATCTLVATLRLL